MFASPAFAQAAGVAGPGGLNAILQTALPFGAVFIIFYLLLIRPQQKRASEHRKTIDAVKKGDAVVTAGGLIGKVTKVDETEVEVEIAPNVRVKVVKATLSDVRTAGSAKPAND